MRERAKTEPYAERMCQACLKHYGVWSDFAKGRCGPCRLEEAELWFNLKRRDKGSV